VIVICVFAPLASLTACRGEGGDLGAFCTTARSFVADNPAAAFAQIDLADPAATSATLDAAATELRAWASDAPREVRDDVDVLVDAAATLAATYADPAITSTDEYVVIDTEAVESASAEVLAFTSERCEVDLDPGTTQPAG
jgi:hypothetical protein